MRTRKDLKSEAKKVFKKHYLIFVVVCVFAAFIGGEFANSLSITEIEKGLSIEDQAIISKVNKNNLDKVVEETKKKEDELKITSNSRVLGRTRGVLSGVINSIQSGSLYLSIIKTINSVVRSANVAIMILILFSFLLTFLAWYFIVNTYKVISRRIFLEGRIYDKVSKSRFLFLFRINKWSKASFTMFLSSTYQSFWTLTIVGGIIKAYSYFLVPYIVCENPDIKAREAITLSRKMMNGHKWECFKLDLSFLGWEILGLFTVGLSKIFYSNPYKVATLSEYYTDLRSLAKNKKIENTQLLNDTYLFEKASSTVLNKEYADIIQSMKKSKVKVEKSHGIKGFFENVFGISLSSREKEKEYEEAQLNEIKIDSYKDAIEGIIYPTRLFTIKEKEKRRRVEVVNYLRRYSVYSIVLMFFIFAFIGWTWEVMLHLISDGVFVNRGVLHGPWLPIYGSGGVLIIILLFKFRKNPACLFTLTVVLCGLVEYFTSYYLEVVHNGQKWWDYSGYFLNLNGRICAEGLLVFGLGGLAIVYIVAPLIDDYLKRINSKLLISLSIVLICLFTIDQVYSKKFPNTGKGITDYAINYQKNKYIESI